MFQGHVARTCPHVLVDSAWKVKLRANGFNIHWVLLKSNVETVCHPLETVLKLVELKLNRCSTFLLLSQKTKHETHVQSDCFC